MFFDLTLKSKIIVTVLFFCFDYKYSYTLFNSSFNFTSVDLFFNRYEHLEYIYSTPIIAFMFLVSMVYLAKILVWLRQIKTYLTIPFFVGLLFILMKLLVVAIDQNNYLGFFVVAWVGLVSKKMWIVFLLALEAQHGKVGWLESFGGVAVPAAAFREKFKLEEYHLPSQDNYWLGVKLSILFIILYCVYFQFQYQINGIFNSFSIINPYSLNLACKNIVFGEIWNISPGRALGKELACYFTQGVFGGIVKHILLDSMIFFIPGLMMGFRFPVSYQNFLKARSWTSFLFNLFYIYSLILYRIFVIEFYKFILDVTKKRTKFSLPLATFFGVALGGALFHINKDFVYLKYFFSLETLDVFFKNTSFYAYFIIIGATCVISDNLKVRIPKMFTQVMITFYFIIFLIGRSLFEGYYRMIPLELKLNYIKKILFLGF